MAQVTAAVTPKGERRRYALIRAAADLLCEGGFEAVTHRAVAERAGLPLASTTYYFASLDEVVEAAVDLLGTADAEAEIGRAARLIGMQLHEETASALGIDAGGAPAFARYLTALLAAQGEDVTCDIDGTRATVRQRGWRLMRDVGFAREEHVPAALRAWNELWIGAASAHDRFMPVALAGDPGREVTWTIG